MYKKKFFTLAISLFLLTSFLIGCTPSAPAPPTATAPAVSSVGSIGDFVWVDRDANGLQDAGEEGMHDIDVKLFDADGTLVASVLTDYAGAYRFTGISSGSYYLEFEAIDFLGFTEKDVGEDDRVDSDVGGGRTDVFAYTSGNDSTWDAGLLVESWNSCVDCHERPTETPKAPTKTPPTATSTPWRVITHGGMRKIVVSFGVAESNCDIGDPFEDTLEVTVGDDLISLDFYQPNAGNRNSGTLAADGTFSVQSEDGNETYTGQFSDDFSGEGITTYIYGDCKWETPVSWVLKP